MKIFSKSTSRVSWLLIAAAPVLFLPLHGSLLIDDFNNTGDDGNAIDLVAIAGNTDAQLQTSPLSGSISNNRDVLLDEVFGVNGIAIVDQINPDTTDGFISFSAAQFFSDADLEFFYGGLGGLDLTDGGKYDAFELFVRSESSFGFGEITWAVGVEDTDSNFDITSDFNVFEGFNRIDFPTTTVDFTSVRAVHLYVNAFSIASVESVQFDDFQAVPEPGAFAAIIAMGAMGFAMTRRRIRK